MDHKGLEGLQYPDSASVTGVENAKWGVLQALQAGSLRGGGGEGATAGRGGSGTDNGNKIKSPL